MPGSAGASMRRSWWSHQPVGVKAAIITAVGAVIAALVVGLPAALLASHSGGGPQDGHASAAPSSPPVTASTDLKPTPQRTTVTYTVDPTEWAPAPVPGLMLTQGDRVAIRAVRGQWVCATVAGPAGIQGNTHYKATYHLWAVPSAPFCSLVGKIGDGSWEELGDRPQFTADRSGTLALTANELMPTNCSQPPNDTSCYTDNEGTITILITIQHAGASQQLSREPSPHAT
jgi:hypothetical protein